jgi:hypothetical protein
MPRRSVLVARPVAVDVPDVADPDGTTTPADDGDGRG